jgi:hypothetical protein
MGSVCQGTFLFSERISLFSQSRDSSFICITEATPTSQRNWRERERERKFMAARRMTCIYIYLPYAELEPAIPAFIRPKTGHSTGISNMKIMNISDVLTAMDCDAMWRCARMLSSGWLSVSIHGVTAQRTRI